MSIDIKSVIRKVEEKANFKVKMTQINQIKQLAKLPEYSNNEDAIVEKIIFYRERQKRRRNRRKKMQKPKIQIREYSEDYLDMLYFAKKAIARGEMTQSEVDEQLKGINQYTFKYDE